MGNRLRLFAEQFAFLCRRADRPNDAGEVGGSRVIGCVVLLGTCPLTQSGLEKKMKMR
jgi:hypothetical protein